MSEETVGHTPQYWIHKVGSLTGPVAEFRMAQLVDFDPRLTEPARIVFRFMVGYYMEDKGNALASVRHVVSTMQSRVPNGATPSRSAVQRAITLLLETGWIARTFTGTGRSASRYVPTNEALQLASKGEFPICVPEKRDTNETELASHSTGTALSHSTGTQTDLASHSTGTKTHLPDPRTDAGTESEMIECATPSAPLAVGLGATAARTAQGFEELWQTYAYRQRKAEARSAFDKLAPSPELVDRMVAAAGAWFSAWSAQNKPDAPRFTLAKWIEREEFECDPPTAFKRKEHPAKERMAKTVSAKVPRLSAAELAMAGEVSPFAPEGTFDVEIVEADVEKLSFDTRRLDLQIKFNDGNITSHSFLIQSPVEDEQERGTAMFKSLCDAVSLGDGIEDTDELLDIPLRCTIGQGSTCRFIYYEPLPANDNRTRKIAA